MLLYPFLSEVDRHCREKTRHSVKIVVKYPTRGRPVTFTSQLEKYMRILSGRHEVHFVISFDEDDETMNNDELSSYFTRLRRRCPDTFHPLCGTSTSKVSAINANLDRVYDIDPDVVVLASDDMVPVVSGYDDVIAQSMERHFPDTDGVLHFDDGFSGGDRLITLAIMGGKYLRRFGYLYYPGYKSVYCDNEFTDVCRMLNKVVYSSQVIIKHDWVGTYTPNDPLHRRNDAPEMYAHDESVYEQRKAINFGLGNENPDQLRG